MIKVSSRFLAVLMLAVLAFTDLTTTSAFGGFIRIRPTPHFHEVLRPHFDHLRPNGVESPGAMHPRLSPDAWDLDDLDAPPRGGGRPRLDLRDPNAPNSQSGGGLRPYPLPDPVLQ